MVEMSKPLLVIRFRIHMLYLFYLPWISICPARRSLCHTCTKDYRMHSDGYITLKDIYDSEHYDYRQLIFHFRILQWYFLG